ncbi:MAG: HD domain-containing protein [Candidatus Anstonellales archaeon]
MAQENMSIWKIILALKKTERRGWTRHIKAEVESIADHSFSTAVLCYAFAKEFKANREKAVEMALLHDLAEAITGDITPFDAKSKEKDSLERKAEKEIEPLIGKDGVKLMKEYREGKTKLAKFVRDMNLLDMVLQAHEYRVEREFEEYAKKRMSKKAKALLAEFLGKNK